MPRGNPPTIPSRPLAPGAVFSWTKPASCPGRVAHWVGIASGAGRLPVGFPVKGTCPGFRLNRPVRLIIKPEGPSSQGQQEPRLPRGDPSGASGPFARTRNVGPRGVSGPGRGRCNDFCMNASIFVGFLPKMANTNSAAVRDDAGQSWGLRRVGAPNYGSVRRVQPSEDCGVEY